MQASWSEQLIDRRRNRTSDENSIPDERGHFRIQFSFCFKTSAKSSSLISIVIHIESSTFIAIKKKISVLDSLSKRDWREFGNGLFWRQQVRDAFQTLTFKKHNKIIFS